MTENRTDNTNLPLRSTTELSDKEADAKVLPKKSNFCTGWSFGLLCLLSLGVGFVLSHYLWPMGPDEMFLLGGRTSCLENDDIDVEKFDHDHDLLKVHHFHEQLCLNHSDAEFRMQGNIIGGRTATIKNHRWQTSIQYRRSRSLFSHFCGGAIIAPQFVLTAAHCFEKAPLNQIDSWKKLHVLVGSDITNTHPRRLHGAQSRRVWSIERHPNWDPVTYANDYALLYLNEKIHYSLSPSHPVGPICMPKPEHDMQLLEAIKSRGDISCKLAGWGVTDMNDPKSTAQLMEVELPWIEKSQCNSLFDTDAKTKWIDITNENLCFGRAEGGIDACQGDSGGSITCTIDGIALTFGVVSWGIGCADANKPGVYGRVSMVTDWIIEQMAVVETLSHEHTLQEHWIERAKCAQGSDSDCEDYEH